MSSSEDLYREMEEQERLADSQFSQNYTMKAVPPRKPVNEVKARERYDHELKDIFETRRRIASGLPPTNNPLINLWLKIRGENKLKELPQSEIVEPTKGFVMLGPTIAEVQKQLAEAEENNK